MLKHRLPSGRITSNACLDFGCCEPFYLFIDCITQYDLVGYRADDFPCFSSTLFIHIFILRPLFCEVQNGAGKKPRAFAMREILSPFLNKRIILDKDIWIMQSSQKYSGLTDIYTVCLKTLHNVIEFICNILVSENIGYRLQICETSGMRGCF